MLWLAAPSRIGRIIMNRFLLGAALSGDALSRRRPPRTMPPCADSPDALPPVRHSPREPMNNRSIHERVAAFVLLCSAVAASATAQTIPQAGLRVWLKADAGVTTSGGSVTAWADQSAAANGFTQAAPAQRPTLVASQVNGLPAIHFDGTQQLQGAGPGFTLNGATIFTLARYTVASSNNDYLYAIGSPGFSGSQMALSRTNGTAPYHYDGSSQHIENDPWSAIPANEWAVFSQTFGATSPVSHDLRRNAVSALSSTALNPYAADASAFVIGNWSSGSYRFVGDLVEMIVYDYALSPVARRDVEDYLRARAGLPPFVDQIYRDLSQFSVVQYEMNAQPDAQWVLKQANTAVDQLVNADPSIFLSDFDVVNTELRGRIGSGSAPDFMGFVFGYQDRGHFYLFDWKKVTASYQNFGVANAGMSIRKVHVVGAGDPTGPDLWGSADTPNITTLFDNTIPWVNGVDYDIRLRFRPGDFEVTVFDGATVMVQWSSQDTTYLSGKFGYYINSLQGVRFGSITLDAIPVGSGCGAGPVPPSLHMNAPILGETLALRLFDGAPNAAGFLAASGIPAAPLALGSGCTAFVDLATFIQFLPVATDAAGAWSLFLPLPYQPSLVGVTLITQVALLPTAGPLGVDLSNGVVLTVQ
jgi:hypothetical protein